MQAWGKFFLVQTWNQVMVQMVKTHWEAEAGVFLPGDINSPWLCKYRRHESGPTERALSFNFHLLMFSLQSPALQYQVCRVDSTQHILTTIKTLFLVNAQCWPASMHAVIGWGECNKLLFWYDSYPVNLCLFISIWCVPSATSPFADSLVPFSLSCLESIIDSTRVCIVKSN